jgi:hypothetical protein
MPLKQIINGNSRRCTARAKRSGQQCLNPAAFGCRTCRVHGARKPASIRRGKDHPLYKHGQETLAAKQHRSEGLAELHALERIGFATGLFVGERWRGRKPKSV